MIGVTNYNMIEEFDLEQLPGPDEVAGDFDVSFGRG